MCEVPLADVLAHLRADPYLSAGARQLAIERVWNASCSEDKRLGQRAAGLPQ